MCVLAGAVVLNLGSLRAEKAFVAPARLHPVGFQARWTYRPVASSPEAAAAGSPKTLPVFECEVTAQGSLPQYNVYLKVGHGVVAADCDNILFCIFERLCKCTRAFVTQPAGAPIQNRGCCPWNTKC